MIERRRLSMRSDFVMSRGPLPARLGRNHSSIYARILNRRGLSSEGQRRAATDPNGGATLKIASLNPAS